MHILGSFLELPLACLGGAFAALLAGLILAPAPTERLIVNALLARNYRRMQRLRRRNAAKTRLGIRRAS